MKKLLQNFDSPLTAFLFLVIGIIAVCFLVAGIFQVYVKLGAMIRTILVIAGLALLTAVMVVGYWEFKTAKK